MLSQIVASILELDVMEEWLVVDSLLEGEGRRDIFSAVFASVPCPFCNKKNVRYIFFDCTYFSSSTGICKENKDN